MRGVQYQGGQTEAGEELYFCHTESPAPRGGTDLHFYNAVPRLHQSLLLPVVVRLD